MTATAQAREYLRVSRDRTGKTASVDQQHTDHLADSIAQGWTITRDPYVDNDVSASRFTTRARGDFDRLMSDLVGGTFGAAVLMIWEPSRGSRRVADWVRLVEACEQAGVRVWVHTHGRLYDPARPRDRRSLLEDALDSEYESAKSSERIRRATRAAASAGTPHGRVLYGYRRVYDDRGRYLEQVEHPEQAPIVREVATRVAAGEPLHAIADDLNGRGVAPPAGPRWSVTAIRRLATRPSYAGLRVHQGQIVGAASWPAILGEDLWQACVARLSDPRRRTTQDTKLRYLLSGVLTCAVCGTGCRVLKSHGKPTYTCPAGFHVAAQVAWVDEFVTEVILGRLERRDAWALLAPARDDTAAAARELSELTERLDGFVDQAAAGKLTAGALARIEARLLPQIEAARQRARPASVPTTLGELPGPGVRERWDGLSVALKREAVALLADLRLRPGRRGERGATPWRLDGSRWRGDPRTWGEHWATGTT